jgi:hypothetical protein
MRIFRGGRQVRLIGRSAGFAALAAATCALSACGTAQVSHDASSAPLTVSISLHDQRTTAGSRIRGFATLTNHTSRSIAVDACAKNGWLDVGLSSPSVPYQPVMVGVACLPTVRLAPGPSRFPITLSTSYQRCAARQVTGALPRFEPRCGLAGTPVLPAGKYVTSVVMRGLPASTSAPRPLTVTLMPPVGVAFSDELLAVAPLPPGATPATVAVPTLRSFGQALSFWQVDVHRLFLVPGTRASIAAFLLHHLPHGARENQGITIQTDPVSYDAEFVPLTMPAAGPNEGQATLLYAFAADGPGLQELRIDAETTSVPDRTPTEKTAATGPVVVTGYGGISLAGGSTQPTSVTLTGQRAAQLRAIFDHLSLGTQGFCMESDSPYEIVFADPGARISPMHAVGNFCGGDFVDVETGSGASATLADPHCLLISEVIRVLPPRTAVATRDALHECRSTYVG